MITKRGQPVAVLTPIAVVETASIIGALRDSVLHYDDPFAPAVEAGVWNAEA